MNTQSPENTLLRPHSKTCTKEQLDYLNTLIGKPWVRGSEGPDSYDCWSCAKHIEETFFGREMPSFTEPPSDLKALARLIRDHPHRKCWQRIQKPVHGALVELAHHKRAFHIGVFLDVDGGGIFHCNQGVGITFDRIVVLKSAGWRGFFYHDWIG